MDVRLVGLGAANPPFRVSQREVYDSYVELVPMSDKARNVLKQILVDNQSIAFRNMAMDSLAEAVFHNTQDELIARYQKHAVPTALEAARIALEQAGLSPAGIDAVAVNTCTGYLCPGLTSYVAEGLGLRKTVRPFELQGMGCGGAIPCLETGYNYLQAHPNRNVLTLSVEMCTATIFFSEDPAILVSNAIFGDGAAATVLTNRENARGLRLAGFASGLFPEYRQYLQYTTEDGKLKNVLSQRVPTLGARCAKQVVEQLLAEAELTQADVDHWVIHTGGEKVLDAFERAVGLPAEALRHSRAVLLNYGNMSSASVLFVLRETLAARQPRPGARLCLASFGAGFSAFAALLEAD
jgi:predicted naringenin-chalcone synthase